MANDDTFGGDYFANLLNSDSQSQAADVRTSLLNGMEANPDQVAQAIPLAKKAGLPLETVERNKAEVEKRYQYDADYFAGLLKRAPNTAAFFETFENAKIAHDDLQNLQGIEGFFARIPKPIVAVTDTLGAAPVGGAVSGVGLGARGIGSTLQDFSKWIMDNPAFAYMGQDVQMMAIMGRIGGFGLKEAGKVVGDVGEAISPPPERQNIVTDVTGGVGQIAGQLAAYAINPALGTAQLVGQGAGQQSDRLDAQGIEDLETRLAAQGLGAAATYATERIGLEVIKKGVQGLRISTSLGKEAVPVGKLLENAPGMNRLIERLPAALKNKWLLRAVDVSAAGAAEAVQEATEGFLQNLIEQQIYNPNAELIAGLEEEAGVAGASGAVARAILMGITRGRISSFNNNAPDPEEVRDWVVQTNGEIQKSNLLRRSPEKFREYVANNYGDDRFYIDAEVASTLYQSLSEADQARLNEAIPGFSENLDEAQLSGADMELSRADYFSYVAPLDLENRLADYLKMDPAHYSIGQIQDAQKIFQDVMASAEADLNRAGEDLSRSEALERRYSDMLMNAGQTPDAARLNAMRMRAAYEAFTDRYGQNEQAAGLIESMLGQLIVERRFADLNKRLPANDMDLFIDRVRNFRTRVSNKIEGAEKRRQTAIRKAQEKAAATGKPFKMPRSGRARKSLDPKNYPMLDFIKRRGGVDPDSPLAGELKHIGVDRKNAPWLFTEGREASHGFFGRDQGARGGRRALDNIDIDDFRQYFGTEPVAAPTNERDMTASYVDEQYILDQVREEMFGNPLIGREQNAEEALFDDFLRVLDDVGVDIDTATNDQIKTALAEAQAQARGEDTLYQDGKIATESAAFKNWFGDSKVVDEDGEPLVVYHGTTHNIEEFSNERANVENDLGRGFYFSNTAADIEANYAGEGPDLTGRIERRAEMIDGEEDIGMDEALERARAELSGGAPNTMPVYLSMQNPVVIGGDQETTFDYRQPYDEETDDFGPEEGTLLELVDALRMIEAEGEYDSFDAQGAIDAIFSEHWDDDMIGADMLINNLKGSEAVQYATDQEGNLAGSEIIRRMFELAGYDGFIDNMVNEKFGSQRAKGKSMVGMNEGTVHYIAFRPDQIKSVFNRGTFDPGDNRVLYQNDAESLPDLLKNIIQQFDQPGTRLGSSGVKFDVSESGDIITVDRIFVPADMRDKGVAGKMVDQLIGYSERTGKKIALSPSSDFGGNKARLTKWYKRLGFVENKGANKDFTTKETMIREPNRRFQDGERGSGPRGQIDFLDDMMARITLWERANLSTLIHEEGHLYWRLLSRIAQIPEAAEAFPNAVKDAKTIRAWVKAEPGQPLTVAQEEQIARGFEAWIMGGEAPSIELQSAFSRFAAWMKSIYEDIKNLGGPVPKEVAEVFERMLATDQEISDLRAQREFKLDDRITAMLTKAEQKRAQSLFDRSTEEAKKQLFDESYKEVKRQDTKAWKEERAKVLEENTRLLDQSALYRAVEFLQKGQFRNPEGVVMEGVAPVKLDRKAVISIMGREVLDYLPPGVLTNKGGVNPDVFADMFGYDSGQALLRSMMNFVPRKERVQQMTDEDMKARHGDIHNDGTLERRATEVFHNKYRQYLLELEVRTLAQAAKMPVPLGVSFKIKAEEIIGKKQVRDLIPYRYYRAAIKAAREAGVALGKGDYVAAAVAKQRQLLNHHLYMMANQRRDYMDKKFRQWKKLTTKSDKDTAKNRDVDYIYAARAILARNGIGRSNFNFQAWMENLRMDDPDTADLMQQTIDTYAAAPKDYRDMSWEEFQGLADAVDNILTIAKERRTVIVDGQKADLDEVAAQIAGTIYANVPIRPDQDPREASLTGNAVEGLSNISTKMITWAEQIDGGRGGIFYRAVQKMVRQAEVTRAQRQREAGIKLAGLYEKYFGDVKIGDYTATFEQLASSPGRRALANLTGGRIDLTGKVYVPELNRSLSREEILSAFFNYGNEDNATKFMEGMGKDPKYQAEWTEDQYLAVISHMRDKDVAFVKEAVQLINSFWPETVALDRRTKGFAAPKIQGRPFSFVSADGTTHALEGWYYPVKYSSDKSSRMSGKILEQDMKELAAGQRSFAATKQGRTKERQESSGEPVRTDLDVIAQAIEEAVTDITMREAVLNTRKLLGHKEVREAIDATLGPKVYAQFTMWLQDVASGPQMTDGAVGAMMRGFRASMSAAAMGFKVGTMMVQPLGIIQAIPEVGSKWMGYGLYRYMTAGRAGPWSAAEQVRELSPFMQVRVYNQNREASEAFRRAQRGGFVNDSEGKLYWGMQKTQQIADTIIWMGAYERAQAPKSKGGEGLTGAAAVDYADLAVETTQGGGLQSSLSAIERGSASERVRQAEAVKSLTVLYSYMNAKYNTYRRVRNKYAQSERGIMDKAHLAGDLFLIMTVETMITSLILGRLPDFDDEDDPEMAAFWYGIRETFKTFLGTLPLVGQAASFMDGFGGGTATQRGIGEIVKSSKALAGEFAAIMSDDEEFNGWKALRAVNTGGIYLSPIKWPAGQVNVMLRAAEKQADGEDVSPVDYLIYRPEN